MAPSSEFPTGTVTFLFTDIEGSTKLLGRLGDRYPEVLERHQRLLRDAFSSRGAVEVSTEGDSFFVVFPAAPAALDAAVAAQRAMEAQSWPDGESVRVRMGLHTGEGTLGGDNYVGVDLHRAARIAATGHGGQIVVSATTGSLVEHATPEGVTLRDLGEHRLRDLPHSERLFQVVVDGLPSEFPPLRSMDARPNNLPVQLTSFVGRRGQVDEIKERLGRSRLLTLTGPGGTGKTRLAIQAATELLPRFRDGAYFVALAPITDPDLVMPTIGQALGLPEATRLTPAESVIEHLREKDVLLILDNVEQVLDGAPDVGQLLTMTRAVHILATSREPLGVSGEQEYPVPPLDLPDPDDVPAPEDLSRYESLALFVERARAVAPEFEPTPDDVAAIAEICARLDGLPLAIELAAARVKVLPPQAMLSRLERTLPFLASGSRDLPQRQRTLRDAIAWSYDLLDGAEQHLFARLSVFVGGFTLEAAETIANPDGELGLDTLEGIASLTNKSLLRQMVTSPGEPRFFMLDTIREFAEERLSQRVEADPTAARHATFFLDLAERAAPQLLGADQARWLDTLALEHDNLRAALTWAETSGELELALRLAAGLWRFWQMRGHLREGRARLEHLLDLPGAEGPRGVRADALEALGGSRYWMGDIAAAGATYEECLALRRELGDDVAIAGALYNFAFTHALPQYENRDAQLAVQLMEEALEIYRGLDDRGGVGRALWGLANAHYQIDYGRALSYAQEALPLFREVGDRFMTAWTLFTTGSVLNRLGRHEEARAPLQESLDLLGEANDTSGIPLTLSELAFVAAARGDGPRAFRLAGAAAAMEAAGGAGLAALSDRAEGLAEVRRGLLEDEEAEERWAEGQAMSVEEAVAYALEDRGN
jgi:predicted ATPase/class 3 adenylate cyclase